MVVDIIFLILVILAVIKGFRRGLIVGLFSLVAIIVGIAAAMKLSTVVAEYVGSAVKVSDRWLPIISFAIVFIIVVLLIRLGANAIERAVEVVTLGWLNKLGGVLLYFAIYTIVFSILLFYAEQVHLVQPDTINKSVTYNFIQPWGPKAINLIGSLIPVFRDMFSELQDFFDGVSHKIPPPSST